MPTTIDGNNGVNQIQDGAVNTSAKLGSFVVTPPKTSGLVVTQANQTPLPGVASLLSFAHGLGAIPVSAELEFVCLTAEFGYVAGDVVRNAVTGANASYVQPPSIVMDATTVRARVGNVNAWYLQNITTGAQSTLTPANWAWRFKVRAA